MEKYRVESLSKWWYAGLVALIVWFGYTKLTIAGVLVLLYFLCLVMAMLQRMLKQALANHKIQKVAYRLEDVHTVSELSKAIRSYPKAKGSLKLYLLNMALEKLSEIGIVGTRINQVVANGRLCYFTGHGLQVPQKKRNGELFYDWDASKENTYFVFPNNFEWVSNNAHQAIPIKNIIEMSLDVSNDMLSVMKRGGGMIYFYGKDIVLLKAIIKSLQSR